MFGQDDDDDVDDEAGGHTRYPVMPSLVAMQQMKNRLHLAYLGKKLMKWTAMATGKELRRLAFEMNTHYDDYGDMVTRAFILLARSRYFCPNMNLQVLNHVGNQAAVRVHFEKRSITGVKVMDMELIEEGFDPNAHLGIGLGGTVINEAKAAWKELLKLMVLMLQEKSTFAALDEANKNATKKQNVLGKLVIPKIIKAIQYIWAELEEQEREESFRLKRFKQTKAKKGEREERERKLKLKEAGGGEKKKEEEETPIEEEPHLLKEPEQPRVLKEPEQPRVPKETEQLPVPKETEQLRVPKEPEQLGDLKGPEDEKPEKVLEEEICPCCVAIRELDEDTGKFVCPICKLAADAVNERQEIKVNMVPCQTCLPEVTENKDRLEHIMAHVNQIIRVARQYHDNKSFIENQTNLFSYTTITEKNELVPYCLQCTCAQMRLMGILPGGPDRETKTCSCDKSQPTESIKCPCAIPKPEESEICPCNEANADTTSKPTVESMKATEIEPCSCDGLQPVKTPATPEPANVDPCCRDEPKLMETEICPCNESKPEKPLPKTVESEICPCDDSKTVKTESQAQQPPKPAELDSCVCDKAKPIEKEICPCDAPKPQTPEPCPCDAQKPKSKDTGSNMSRTWTTRSSECPVCPASYSATAVEHSKSLQKAYSGLPVTASLSYDPCPAEMARKISKAAIPYLGRCGLKSHSKKGTCFPVCQGDASEKIAKASAPYLRSAPCKKYPCTSLNCDEKPFAVASATYYTTPSQITTPFTPEVKSEHPDKGLSIKSPKASEPCSKAQSETMICPICTQKLVLDISALSHGYKNSAAMTSKGPDPCCKSQSNTCRNCSQKMVPDTSASSKSASSDCLCHLTNQTRKSPFSKDHTMYYAVVPQWLYSTPFKQFDAIKKSTKQYTSEETQGYYDHDMIDDSAQNNCLDNQCTRYNDLTNKAHFTHPTNDECDCSYHVGLRNISDKINSIKSKSCSQSAFNRNYTTYYSQYYTLYTRERRRECGHHRGGRMVMKDVATYVTTIPHRHMPSRSHDRKSRRCSNCMESGTRTSSQTFNPYTREGRPGPCGPGMIDKVIKVTNHTTLYKHEGKPRPCGPCGTIDTATQITPYTREGKPGPCGPGIADTAKPDFATLDTGIRKPCRPCGFSGTDKSTTTHGTPYTREGRPGPCGPGMTDTVKPDGATSHTGKKRPCGPCRFSDSTKSITSDGAPYTREGRPGPCGPGMSDTAYPFKSYSASHIQPGKSKPCGPCGFSDEAKSSGTPYTREGRPGPCGPGMSDTAYPFKSDSASHIQPGKSEPCRPCGFSDAAKSSGTPYTREGKPGPCGPGMSDTAYPFKSYSASHIQPGKSKPCGPCGFTDAVKSSGTPYTREGRPGPCEPGMFATKNPVTGHSTSNTRERSRSCGPCCTASSNTSHLTPYTREGRPGPCGPGMTDTRNSDTAYTREGCPGSCGTYGASVTAHPVTTHVTPYTREGRPGPCGPGMSVMDNSTQCSITPNIPEGKPGPISPSAKCHPFCKDPAVYYYFSKIPRHVVKPKNTDSDNFETLNLSHILRTTKSNVTATHNTSVLPQFTRSYTCDPFKSSIISMCKDACTYVKIVPQQRSEHSTLTANASLSILTSSEDLHYVESSYSLDSRVSSSAADIHYANYAFFLSDVYSDASTAHIMNIPSTKYRAVNWSSEKEVSGNLSALSITHSTVTVNYVICQSDIQAAINKASAAYVDPSQLKKVSEACPFYKKCGNFDPNDMGVAIAKASAPYIKNTPSVHTKSVESMPNAVFGLPSDCCGAYKSGNQTSKTPVSNVPKWFAPNCMSIPSGYSPVSSRLTPTASAQVPKDICAPYFSSVKSNSGTVSYSLQDPKSCSCRMASANSSYIKPVATPVFMAKPVSKADKTLPSENSICSNCGKCKNLPPSETASSTVDVKIKTICPSHSSKISNTSNKVNDMGYVETEFKEITKVSRYKNPDGTIVDEKQIITIKTEKKTRQKLPDMSAMDVGTCISCSQEYDIKNHHKIDKKRSFECRPSHRDTKSDIVCGENDLVVLPTLKRCISAREYGISNNTDILFGAWEAGPELEITVSKTQLTTLMPCLSSDMTCGNRLTCTAKGAKCNCKSKGTSMTIINPAQQTNICNAYNTTNYDYVLITPQPYSQFETTICANMLDDIRRPEFNYTNKPLRISIGIGPTYTDPIFAYILQHNANICPQTLLGKCTGTYDNANKLKDDCGTMSGYAEISTNTATTCCPIVNRTEENEVCSCDDKTSIDTDDGPICSCPETSPCISDPVCANRLEDTDSGPKCSCGVKSFSNDMPTVSKSPKPSTWIPTGPLSAIRNKGTSNDSDCSCPEVSAPMPTCSICGNNLEKTDSGLKCTDRSPCIFTEPKCSAPEKAPCMSKDEILNSKIVYIINDPDCNCLEKAQKVVPCADPKCNVAITPEPTCALCGKKYSIATTNCPNVNRPEDNEVCSCDDKTPSIDTDHGPMCSCPEASPCVVGPVCANRPEDTDSGPKCSCGVKSFSTDMPVVSSSPKPSPWKATGPLSAIRNKGTINGSDCSCPEVPVPMPTCSICGNNLEKTDSGLKCTDRSPCIFTEPKCSAPEKAPCMSKDEILNRKIVYIINDPDCNCLEKSQKVVPCVDPKCNVAITPEPTCALCGKKYSIATTNCPNDNRTEDNEVCSCDDNNLSFDTDHGPMCSCPEASPCVVGPVCANRPEDTDSGPKCSCGVKSFNTDMPAVSSNLKPSPWKATGPLSAIRNKGTINGSDCSCAEVPVPMPTCSICGNNLEKTDSGLKCKDRSPCIFTEPKCSAPEKAPCMLKDEILNSKIVYIINDPDCNCLEKAQKVVPCADPKCNVIITPEPTCVLCGRKVEDLNIGPRCTCTDRTSSVFSDSDAKCCCPEGSPCRMADPVQASKIKYSVSGPECTICPECTEGSPSVVPGVNPNCSGPGVRPIPSCVLCGKKIEDIDNGPRCTCMDRSSIISTDSEPECSCPEGSPCMVSHAVCSNKLKSTLSDPECICPEDTVIKPTCVECDEKTKDLDSAPKCSCIDKSDTIFTDNKSECNCPEGSPCMVNQPVCANQLKSNVSQTIEPESICPERSPCMVNQPVCVSTTNNNSPERICPKESTFKPACQGCGKQIEEFDREPKCACTAQSSSVSSDSEPECSCPKGAPCMMPTPARANKLKDSLIDSDCICPAETPKVISNIDSDCGCPEGTPHIDAKIEPKCSFLKTAPAMATPVLCGKTLKATDSNPKCICTDRTSSIVTGLEPKCSCPEGAPCTIASPVCVNKLEENNDACFCSNTSPNVVICIDTNCSCTEDLPCIATVPALSNRLDDCSCIEKLPMNTDRLTDTSLKYSCQNEPSCTVTDASISTPQKVNDSCLKYPCSEETLNISVSRIGQKVVVTCESKSHYGTSTTTLDINENEICETTIKNVESGVKCDCSSDHELVPQTISEPSWLKYKPRQEIEKYCGSKYTTESSTVIIKEVLAESKKRCDAAISWLRSGSVTNPNSSVNNSVFLTSTEQSCIEYKIKSIEDTKPYISDHSHHLEYLKNAEPIRPAITFKNISSSTSDLNPCNINPQHSSPVSIWRDWSKIPNAKGSKAQCTVKLTRKPAKTRCCQKNDEGIFFKGSFLESLRKILLLAKAPRQRPDKYDAPKICKSCYSPLSASFQLKIYPPPCSVCNINDPQSENERDKEDDALNYPVHATTPSCKSVGVDNSKSSNNKSCYVWNKGSCCSSAKPDHRSTFPAKRSCQNCLKNNNEYRNLIKNFSTPNCTTRSTCCKNSSNAGKSNPNEIRPIRKGKIVHVCANIRPSEHRCHSDSCISDSESRNSVKKTCSYNEDFI